MAKWTEERLAAEARRELCEGILPFWRQRTVDEARGGFIGEMTNDLRVQPDAAKGLILNGRLLWTFSAAYRLTRLGEDQRLARRAYEYLTTFFRDAEHGGFYWELDPWGRVRDDKKKIYGQAFVVYALAEYYRTFGERAALEEAIRVFQRIEGHAQDTKYGGYFETLTRSWGPCEDMRLSDKDMNEKKSMNTHLHVLEAYTNLARVWSDPLLVWRLRELIELFLRRILNREHTHLHHFFDETWAVKSDTYTYGHDIEASWLLCEAAAVLGEARLIDETAHAALQIARAVLREAMDEDGGIFYEGRDGAIVNSDKEWWPQTEAVVGFYNVWQLTGDDLFHDAAVRCWQFTQQRLVDRPRGEWYWKVSAAGVPDETLPKVSAWKCPYHNGRCCLELLHRTQFVINSKRQSMTKDQFKQNVRRLFTAHRALLQRENTPCAQGNGVFERFRDPVLTADHTPLFWRYDLDPERNPFLMERLGVNAAFNPGAIELDGKVCLAARVEGADRKSFFAIAESESGIDRFRFWDLPLVMPETADPDINVYDLRLVRHEDGWIYGLFCTERKDPSAPRGDLSSAVAQCGIARTKDLKNWERLDDLRTPSPQQRNVVLHPKFVEGKYALYTRPQDGFINTGSGGGIGWGLADSMEHAVIASEKIVHDRKYHTIYEAKNGLGPAPIETPAGWLQLAHGVRNTAAGLRYVLYAFMTALEDPSRVIYEPGGYLLAPRDAERVGDVSNVTFANGWVKRANGDVLLYYASSDTRCHVARSTVDRLVDYCRHTPRDPLRSAACVGQRLELIQRNLVLMQTADWAAEFKDL